MGLPMSLDTYLSLQMLKKQYFHLIEETQYSESVTILHCIGNGPITGIPVHQMYLHGELPPVKSVLWSLSRNWAPVPVQLEKFEPEGNDRLQ